MNFRSFIIVAVLMFAGSIISCSKCYDCTTEVYIEDTQGNIIDTTTTVDDFCTSDTKEVQAKEDAGATCVEK